MRSLHLFVLLLFASSTLIAGRVTNLDVVRISTDPLVYRATYTPPSSSPLSRLDYNEPVHCISKSTSNDGVAHTATRMTKTDTGYQADITIPASAISVNMYVLGPFDEMYNADNSFNVDNPEKTLLPNQAFLLLDDADEALRIDRELYPWNYNAYLRWLNRKGATGSLDPSHPRWELLRGVLDSIERNRNDTRSESTRYFLTFHSLLQRFKGGIADHELPLMIAATAFKGTPDDIACLNDPWFWDQGSFCSHTNNGRVVKQNLITAYQDLAVRYPASRMARTFVMGLTPETDIDPVALKALIDFHLNASDADMLIDLADVLVDPKGKHFDPHIAECLYRAAIEACQQQPYIISYLELWPSAWSIDVARLGVARSIMEQGHLDEANQELETAMRSRVSLLASGLFRDLRMELAHRRGDVATERMVAATYTHVKDVDRIPDLGRLFVADANAGETLEQYTSRQREEYLYSGWNSVVPDLVLQTTDGKKIRISDLVGKVVVISLYDANGRQSVVQQMAMDTVAALYGDSPDVVMIDIVPGSLSAENTSRSLDHANHHTVIDDGSIAEQLDTTTGAAFIIIDGKGRTFSWHTAFATYFPVNTTIHVRTAVDDLLGAAD